MPRVGNGKTFFDYFRAKAPDDDRLSDLVSAAKGEFRTLVQFAKDCGVSPSAISRIINKKNAGPCSDMLIKRISDNADPNSGVTEDMLLDAHGLVRLPKTVLDSMMSENANQSQSVQASGDNPDNLGVKNLRVATKRIFDNFEEEARSIIQLTLLEKGYYVRRRKEFEDSNSEFRKLGERTYDLALETNALPEFWTWLFEIKNASYNGAKNYIDGLIVDFSNGNISDYYQDKKISLVVPEFVVYKELCFYYRNARINNCVSIIFINREKGKVFKEFTLEYGGMSNRFTSVFLGKNIERSMTYNDDIKAPE